MAAFILTFICLNVQIQRVAFEVRVAAPATAPPPYTQSPSPRLSLFTSLDTHHNGCARILHVIACLAPGHFHKVLLAVRSSLLFSTTHFTQADFTLQTHEEGQSMSMRSKRYGVFVIPIVCTPGPPATTGRTACCAPGPTHNCSGSCAKGIWKCRNSASDEDKVARPSWRLHQS